MVTLQQGADERVVRAAAMAADKDGLAAGRFGELAFRPGSPVGAHALRIAARVHAVQGIVLGINDVEGSDCIDLEVQSEKIWVKWRKSLTLEQRLHLRIWRQGAVWTSTRRWRNAAQTE